jgi:Peptidase S46
MIRQTVLFAGADASGNLGLWETTGTAMRSAVFAALFLSGAALAARAEEGMWTFNNFPSEAVALAYGFKPDQAWLDHVRLSSLRLAGGPTNLTGALATSGSFASA